MMRIKYLSQSLKYYFANQGKNAPKQANIEFNFKIPKKKTSSQPEISQNNDQVKITKAKRKDVLKILKKKQQNEEYKMKILDSYQEKYEKKIQQNINTANYHQQQYHKGQHLLENIPLDPYYSYKLADFQRKYQAQKQKFKEFVGRATDYDLKAQIKNTIADLYHEKQTKYQVQQFLRYLDQYPGSPKGPRPEDDPDFYIQYASKKMPPILAVKLAGQNKLTVMQNKIKTNKLEDLQQETIKRESTYTDLISQNRSLDRQQGKIKGPILFSGNINEDESAFHEYEEIPEVPQIKFNNYQQWMRDLTHWRNFKNYYVKKHGQSDTERQISFLNKISQQNDPQPDNPYFTPKPAAPSLLRYYKTLPKQIQDNPGVKTIYLGLQFHCPYISYEEKQQALNMAAAMVQPLDKVSVKIMEDFVSHRKYYLTPFIVDKIFSINPQFTWDINDFFEQIKRQQLKGQSMIKQNQGTYPVPPPIHLDWQQGAANLPVDYYDNDDGFWDDIISEKLKRQDQARPIMRHRKHFMH